MLSRLMLMERNTTPTDSKRFRLRLKRKQQLFSAAFNLCALVVLLHLPTQENQIFYFYFWPFAVTQLTKLVAGEIECRRRQQIFHQIVGTQYAFVCVRCASGNYLIVASNRVAAAKKSNHFFFILN